MANEENSFNSLVPLEDFKALMGIDDREERTARFCLLMASLSIEQYYPKNNIIEWIIKLTHVLNLFD